MPSLPLSQNPTAGFSNQSPPSTLLSSSDQFLPSTRSSPTVMLPQQPPPNPSSASPPSPPSVQPSSPRVPPCHPAPSAGGHRKIAIAVDLSDESAFAVHWAVQHYLRPGDSVVLLHVQPTSVLYGADWGSVDLELQDSSEESQKKREDDFDAFTAAKVADLAQPLVAARVPFKIHIVKDHDMKERLCLEVERLGFSAVITGSHGFGASRRRSKGRLGSVSDYCVHHCVCPVIVVRCPDEKDGSGPGVADAALTVKELLHPLPEEPEK